MTVGVISAYYSIIQEMEPAPNHGDYGSSKRPLLDNPPTPDTANLRQLVASRTDSPLRPTPTPNTTNDVDEHLNESPDDLPFTQDPTVLNPIQSPQRPKFVPLMPLRDIPSLHVGWIKDAIRDVYGFGDTRPFQIEAIHHTSPCLHRRQFSRPHSTDGRR